MSYKISIEGIAAEYDVTEVAEKFAHLFHIDEKKALNILFKKVKIKNELDNETANRYKIALESIGVLCSIESSDQINKEMDVKNSNENNFLKNNLYSEAYDTIDKYYKSKNEMFRLAIDIVCHADDIILTEETILNEIDRYRNILNSNLDADDEYDLDEDDIARIQSFARFYEDILRFRDYFNVKGITLDLNEILSVIKEVQQNNIQEENNEFENNLFESIKEMLEEEYTEVDIIKNYIIYNVYRDNSDLLAYRCIVDLPNLLSRFGYSYDEFSDELRDKYNYTIAIIQAESFESNIGDSYDEIFTNNDDLKNNEYETYRRNSISSSVKREVWRRDNGTCSNCGSRENLEYDHIIPVSKGGSNTARNIELLCQSCNRKKSNKIL